MIGGYATSKDTSSFLEKYRIVKKETPWFCISPIAIGTHLGNMDQTDSELYQTSIEYGLKNGINFIDTAINYRGMRSERDIGIVISRLISEGLLLRSEFVISSKAGIIPGDIDAGLVPKDYLQKVLLDQGVLQVSDLNIVEHHRHVLAPSYYEFAIEQSKTHLGLETIDIHYIHNPEISMEVLGEEDFYKKLEPLFLFYEDQVRKGNIRFYGFATWNSLICDPNEKGYISLGKVVDVVKELIGENHHFKFIQCPFNSVMDEAKHKKTQLVNQNPSSVLEAANQLDLTVVTSAPFNSGKLISTDKIPDTEIQSILNEPEIRSVMVGMKNLRNVINNLKLIKK
ncbi:aldo/keto reductase [Pseudalkalibacillus caeni]|uniref:Aldo/keto reductase n=1 Tax=Exobacillus caeni TaxID=2574798 RepID=A0A5R9EYF4_9BACL|nr:aldo/keto reductase [Pseudalkalibacillus caeni]TLS36177.1 aldo/keto reductase [Pseudalkalibacillus caeni]